MVGAPSPKKKSRIRPCILEFNFEGTMGSVFIKRVSILKSGSYKLS